jgi:lipopolysaccharide export LptBFGC system permease protein LptF
LKVITRYVVAETLRVGLMALLVFTAIFFVASSITATRGGITLVQFFRITPFIALYVVRFTLPISLLVGAAFALGRLAADREILALRACGVHFTTIAVPLLTVGLLCSAGLFVFNDRALPVCDYARRDVLKSFARELLTLQKGRNKSFNLPGYSVFCREYGGRTLRGLMIFRDDPELPFEIVAREGRVWLSRDEMQIIIALKDVRITYYGSRDEVSYGELVCENYSIYVPMRQRTRDRPGFMTMAELAAKSRELQGEVDSLKSSALETEQARQEVSRKISKLSRQKRKVDIEYHRRGADSLTPFLFLLVAIPIPLLLNSRVRLVPAFVALMTVMLTHFAVGLCTESFAESGRLDPWFAMWLGSIITVCVGFFLFWKLSEK